MDDLEGLRRQIENLRANLNYVSRQLDALEARVAEAAGSADAGKESGQPPASALEAMRRAKAAADAAEAETPVESMPRAVPAPAAEDWQKIRPVIASIDLSRDAWLQDKQAARKAAVPPPTPPTPAKPSRGFEAVLAEQWFLWIGVLAVAVGLIYLAREVSLNPMSRVVGAYLASLAVIGVGLWQERRDQRWGRVIAATGAAATYFVSFAAGFIEPMQVIASRSAAFTLLAVNVVALFAFAHWKRSQLLAAVALLFGYFTTGATQSSFQALWSLVFLSVAAVSFMLLNRWFYASALAVVATYASHLYSLVMLPRPAEAEPSTVFWINAAFLTAYFVIFSIGLVLARDRAGEGAEPVAPWPTPLDSVPLPRLMLAATRFNTTIYAGAMVYLLASTRVYWDYSFVYFFGLCAASALLARVQVRTLPIAGFHVGAAATAFAFGLVSALSARWMPVFLSAQAVAMLFTARRTGSKALEVVSLGAILYPAYLLAVGPESLLVFHFVKPVEPALWTVAAAFVLQLLYLGLWAPEGLDRRRPALVGEGSVLAVIFGLTHVAAAVRYGHDPDPVLKAIAASGALALVSGSLFGALLPAVAGAVVTCVAIAGCGLVAQATATGMGVEAGFMSQGALAFAALCGFVAGLFSHLRTRLPGASARPAELVSFTLGFFALAALLALRNGPLWGSQWALIAGAGAVAALGLRSSSLAGAAAALGVLVGAHVISKVGTSRGLAGPVPELMTGFCGMTVLALALGSVPLCARVKDASRRLIAVLEVAFLLVATAYIFLWATVHEPATPFRVLAAAAALYVAASVILWRLRVTVTGLGVLGLAGLLCVALVEGRQPDLQRFWAGMTTVALFVITEQVLWRRRRLTIFANPGQELLADGIARGVSLMLAGGAAVLVMFVLPMHPAIRSGLYTASLVVVGLLWFGLGLVFRSVAYRQVALAVVCFGIGKAFLYDVRHLDNVYRIISMLTLGGILVTIALLSARFRGRIGI